MKRLEIAQPKTSISQFVQVYRVR